MPDAKEKITDAELEIMHVLWESKEPMTITQIKSALRGRNGDTIKTLLRRLCQKGAAAQEKREVYYYHALVSQDELSRFRTQRLIDRLYAGSAKALAAQLVKNEQLRPQDIDELRELYHELWEKEGN